MQNAITSPAPLLLPRTRGLSRALLCKSLRMSRRIYFLCPWAVAPCNGLQPEQEMLTLARAACGTQGSARDEAQPTCTQRRSFKIISLTSGWQQLVFPQLVLRLWWKKKSQ